MKSFHFIDEPWKGSCYYVIVVSMLVLLRGIVEGTGTYREHEVQKHQELDYLGKGHQLFPIVFNNASA